MDLQYRIEFITTRQFAIYPENIDLNKSIDASTSFHFSTDYYASTVRFTNRIQYIQEDKILLMLEYTCNFAIKPESAEQIRKEGKISIDLLKYMASIATATARGIVHAKTQGTRLDEFVLPSFDLTSKITEDLVLPSKDVESKK